MLVTVTIDHLIKQPEVGEIIDSIGTVLLFTAVFAVGAVLGGGLAGQCSRWRAFLHRMAAGLVMQVIIWGFWWSVAESIRYTFGVWPLVGHVVLIGAAGYVTSRSTPRTACCADTV